MPRKAQEKPEKSMPVIEVPVIASLAELDEALAELGRMDAVEAEIAALVSQSSEKLISENAARLMVEVDGKSIAFADRRKGLETAAETFCKSNRANILEEGRKSRELNHGKFGWRDTKAGLDELADFDDKGNPELLDDLLELIREFLAEQEDTLDFSRYVDIKLTWSKTELLADAKKKVIQPRTLARTGFVVRPKGEKFYVEPKSETVESQPTQ
jgi:hypothetical protein